MPGYPLDVRAVYLQAAILAARRNLKEISKEEISDALERIVAGPEKKGAIVTEAKKRLVAYHEVRGAAPREWAVPCCAPADFCRARCQAHLLGHSANWRSSPMRTRKLVKFVARKQALVLAQATF